MTPQLRRLSGSFSPQQVEQLFDQWRQDNADQHRYSITFETDGRAASQFDQLKFNWFEQTPANLLKNAPQ
jgi:hypothetical protein